MAGTGHHEGQPPRSPEIRHLVFAQTLGAKLLAKTESPPPRASNGIDPRELPGPRLDGPQMLSKFEECHRADFFNGDASSTRQRVRQVFTDAPIDIH